METASNYKALELSPPTALPLGSVAPYFSGLDQNGNFQSLDRVTSNGPAVIIFYRGHWCFLCKKHIAKFQKGLDRMAEDGFPVILITPEKPKYISKTVKENAIKFPVIYDSYNYIMNDYKVAKPSADKALTASLRKVDLREINDTENPVLPVPATYIIGQDGLIKYGHFNLNYALRSSFKTVAKKVQELKAGIA